MKKLFTSFALALGIGFAAHAQLAAQADTLYFNPNIFQSVNSGVTTITPGTGNTPGLSPSDTALPCSVIGQAVSDTIYFTNFNTFSVATVNSLKIDSLYLPTGLTWKTSHANNTFANSENGVIYVSGTTNVAQGMYKLRIIVDIDATIVGTLHNKDAEALAGLRYEIRVINQGCSCPPINRADSMNVYTPYNCIPANVVATITPAGNVNVCTGSAQTLTAGSGPNYTYLWSTGATTQSISVSAAGPYTVKVYSGTDSATSAATVIALVSVPTVSVSPTGTDSVCQGSNATLTASPAGLNYAWSNTAQTTQTVNVTAAGSYSVTATDVNHCTAVSNAVSVVVNALPVATITRNGAVLTASTGTTYQWYKGGAILTGETNATLTPTSNGSYTVVVTNASGCSATSSATSVTNVGISDVNANIAIRLYPNPSAGILTLETSSRTGDKYEIYDQLGRVVLAKTITADKMIVDMSGQATGMYYLTVTHNAVAETVRFTIAK